MLNPAIIRMLSTVMLHSSAHCHAVICTLSCWHLQVSLELFGDGMARWIKPEMEVTLRMNGSEPATGESEGGQRRTGTCMQNL